MIINSIQLKNIGLYKNDLISFSSSNNKDVLIMWGNNGAGKTTLINSIKIGLLGKEALQMSYSDYCQFIKDKLISTRCDKNNTECYVRIGFKLKENHKKTDYVLERAWKITGDEFEESVNIFSGSETLSFEKKEAVINSISRSLPNSLLNVVVFDGENAIDILNEGKINSLIKSIVYSVFGMDVYAELSKDLTLFLRSGISDGKTDTEERMNFINLENNYKTSRLSYEKIDKLLKQEEKKRTAIIREISFIAKRFKEKTGIEIDGIEEINTAVSNVEILKDKMNSDIKYINEEVLPLKLVHKRIKAIINEIDKEKPYLALKNINELRKFFSDTKKAIDLLEKLEHFIPSEQKETIKYDISDSDYKTLTDIDKILDNYSRDSLLKMLDEKNSFMSDVRERLEIANRVEDPESRSLIAQLDSMYQQLQTVVDNINTLYKESEEKKEKLQSIKGEYELRKNAITKQKKESDSYIEALKYRDAIDKFINSNITQICADLNRRIFEDLRSMRFRNSSIGNVVIDPNNFDIFLYEKSGNLIPSELFSAGEKQILLGLVIKNSLAMSNTDNFFLFDTPVGRLDKENRGIFTNEVIFNVSNQVIVFATDSDYSEQDYNQMKKKITKELILRRNSKDEIVVKEGSIYR